MSEVDLSNGGFVDAGVVEKSLLKSSVTRALALLTEATLDAESSGQMVLGSDIGLEAGIDVSDALGVPLATVAALLEISNGDSPSFSVSSTGNGGASGVSGCPNKRSTVVLLSLDPACSSRSSGSGVGAGSGVGVSANLSG